MILPRSDVDSAAPQWPRSGKRRAKSIVFYQGLGKVREYEDQKTEHIFVKEKIMWPKLIDTQCRRTLKVRKCEMQGR